MRRASERVRFAAALLAALPLASCRGPAPAPAGSAASVTAPATPAITASAGPAAPPPARVAELSAIEHRRDARAVLEVDLTHRDVTVRRAAARALARVADEAAAAELARALADEDPQVIAWAAYGLGWACRGREGTTTRALALRAASLAAQPPAPEAVTSAIDAIADAIGRCAHAEGERTLTAWLSTPRPQAESAALALGRLASRRQRLDDTSLVALLDAAGRAEEPLDSALLAFTRLPPQREAVQARLLDLAVEALGGGPRRRALAIRALGRAGAGAAAPLARLLTDAARDPSERADAAIALGRVGAAGQAALHDALPALVALAEPADAAPLLGPLHGVVRAALEALTPPERHAQGARAALERLAALPVGAEPRVRRRQIALRCRAAALLAPSARDATLRACDPEGGREGLLAEVGVLARARARRGDARRLEELARHPIAVVRQAALDALPVAGAGVRADRLLAEALAAPEAGTVATAAQLLAAHPDLASEPGGHDRPARDDAAVPAPAPARAVVEALGAALARERPGDAVETRAALLDAVAALGVLSARPALEAACKSSWPVLRERAERGLRALGERRRECRIYEPDPTPPPELASVPQGELRLEVDSDAGPLVLLLDPAAAPAAVSRVAELARAGFYDGTAVHRVAPGFVVQFGDPGGDGYGGAGRAPLRCETSPLPYEALRVGVALAGRDTGSSQLFVTLGWFPHLDGEYTQVGRAEPGWERLAVGDVLRRVSVRER
ncbi:MAG: peptidylprolyl isomerase [Polyangiaceae bacterium]|nr:peptidylprolyl isomerase [Polyangiaceae bacterium]